MRPNLSRDKCYGIVFRILGKQAEEGMREKRVTEGSSRRLGGTLVGLLNLGEEGSQPYVGYYHLV